MMFVGKHSSGSSPDSGASRMGQVRTRATAREDLVAHFVYLAESASLETAERFLTRAEESFTDLASHPDMGSPLALRARELAGVRKWRVKEFENFLIFYQPGHDGVTVIRVLHASRDWWALLGLL